MSPEQALPGFEPSKSAPELLRSWALINRANARRCLENRDAKLQAARVDQAEASRLEGEADDWEAAASALEAQS